MRPDLWVQRILKSKHAVDIASIEEVCLENIQDLYAALALIPRGDA